MSQGNPNARDSIDGRKSRLDQDSFIRARLFGDDRSAFARYADLAFRSFSWPKLIRYELLMLFIGPMPGALGFLLRKWLFPALFRKSGKDVIFGANLVLRHADRIDLGDGVVLDRDCLLDARGAGDQGIVIGDRVIVSSGAAIQSKVGHIEIGTDCNIGSHVDIVAQGPIIIEDHVSIAGNAMIAGGRHVVELSGSAEMDGRTGIDGNTAAEGGAGVDGNTAADGSAGMDAPRFTSGPIRLGRNARIGMGAIVQDGVTIGENAIIAPGSVVFENVPPNTVVWGNPARPVRRRRKAERTPEGGPAPPSSARCTSGYRSGEDPEPIIRQQVREYLQDDLFIQLGPGEFSETDSLVDAGILDSLALVRLSMWIEQRFRIEVDLATLNASDLESVDKIVDLIGRHVRT